MIVETIHVNFDELPQMASNARSISDPAKMFNNGTMNTQFKPVHKVNKNVPQVAEDRTTPNDWNDNSPMFSELLNGTSPVVSKSFTVHAADNPDKRQQHNTTHSSTTTDLETDGENLFHTTVSQTEPKNIKEVMADSAWMNQWQAELHQFVTIRCGESISAGHPKSRLHALQMSLAEAEYVSLSACCANSMDETTLTYYGFH
ncbi:hypothetical protein Tco_0705437 [Tanacetum coccineum]|uniref:Uncharacterized protein n=1 Tax=Tanacetum coccineum TaxID=301880 RepID=A0ABQ4Y4R3_9ASTR